MFMKVPNRTPPTVASHVFIRSPGKQLGSHFGGLGLTVEGSGPGVLGLRVEGLVCGEGVQSTKGI